MQQLLTQGRGLNLTPRSATSPPATPKHIIALPRKNTEQSANQVARTQAAHYSAQLQQLQQQGLPAITSVYSLADGTAPRNGHTLTLPMTRSPSTSPILSPLHQLSQSVQASKLAASHSPLQSMANRTPSPNMALVMETAVPVNTRPPPIQIQPTIGQVGRHSSLMEELIGTTPTTPVSPYAGQQGNLKVNLMI